MSRQTMVGKSRAFNELDRKAFCGGSYYNARQGFKWEREKRNVPTPLFFLSTGVLTCVPASRKTSWSQQSVTYKGENQLGFREVRFPRAKVKNDPDPKPRGPAWKVTLAWQVSKICFPNSSFLF